MVNGIEHVAVVSKDTAALKDWYMEMYGGELFMTMVRVHIFFSLPTAV